MLTQETFILSILKKVVLQMDFLTNRKFKRRTFSFLINWMQYTFILLTPNFWTVVSVTLDKSKNVMQSLKTHINNRCKGGLSGAGCVTNQRIRSHSKVSGEVWVKAPGAGLSGDWQKRCWKQTRGEGEESFAGRRRKSVWQEKNEGS